MVFGGKIQQLQAQGSSLLVGDGAAPIETFYRVAFVTAFSGFTAQKEVVDSSSILAPNQYKTFIGSQKSYSPLTLSLLLFPKENTHTLLYQYANDTLEHNFVLSFSDGQQSEDADQTLDSRLEFSALVLNFGIEAQLAESLKATTTLQPTGEVLFL